MTQQCTTNRLIGLSTIRPSSSDWRLSPFFITFFYDDDEDDDEGKLISESLKCLANVVPLGIRECRYWPS